MSSATEDLAVLERVFLKLAMIEGDSQLENFLTKFLSPLIAKLDTTDEVVRSKVVEVLNHINKRLKSASNVPLPVECLLDLYAVSKSSFVLNFAFVYVKMGFHKFLDSTADRVALVNRVTLCLEKSLNAHSSSFLQMLVVSLSKYTLTESQGYTFTGLSEKQRSLLLDLILNVLICSYNFTLNPNPPENAPAINAPPGLTELNFRQATGDIISNLYLESGKYAELKVGLTKFLANSTLDVSTYTIHLMISNADTIDNVATVGEMQLRRITVDYEDKQLIERLYALYLGDPANKPANEHFRVAADLRLRLKLVGYLSKSRLAPTLFPQNVQIAYETFFGNGGTNVKLKQKVLDFVQAISNIPSTNPVKLTVLPLLFTAVNKVIRETQEGHQQLKVSAYVTLGKIGAAANGLVNKDISLVTELFATVKLVSDEVSAAIIECLCSWAPAFQLSDATVIEQMESLITTYVGNENPKCRLVAVKYIDKIFETNHVASRYLLCLMCGDNAEDIRREAKKVLLGSLKSSSSAKLPEFANVVDFFYEKADQRLATGAVVNVGNIPLPFAADTFLAMIRFMRMCLFQTVGLSVSNASQVENLELYGPTLRKWVECQLRGPQVEWENHSVIKYVKLLVPMAEALQEISVWSFLNEILATSNWKLSYLVAPKISWMKGSLIETANDQLVSTAAEIIAGVMVKMSDCQLLADYMSEILKKSENGAPGCQNHVIVIGYLIGRIQRSRLEDKQLEKLSEKCFKQLTSLLSKDVQLTVVESVATAIYEICRSDNAIVHPIYLPDTNSGSIEKIVDFALEMIQSRKESVKPKLKEKLISALSVVVGRDDQLTRKVLEGLMTVGEGPPQPEMQFNIGEALVHSALGFKSPARRDQWIESESDWYDRCNSDSVSEPLVVWLIDEVLKKSQSSNRHLRQSVYIWLFIILKLMQKEKSLTERLLDVQAALGNGLAENNDLTQDVVSKGMGLLYELGTPDQQKRLVELLVETLMTGKRQTAQITGETELFDRNLMGKTPTGDNISTYQELCSLASDLNKPDLIYQFMSIANHQSLWNSKAGAAFGVTTVMTHAKEQLKPFLPKIVPRLYRYQFDPNPKVQQSMKVIWSTLLSNEKGIVEKFSQEIFLDIMKNLINNQWRVRESSCLACSDLVSSQGLFGFREQLEELWDTLFRVRDDIKESVRLAAEKTLQTLKKVVVNRCVGAEAGDKGKEVLGITLKVVLEKGLQCKASEVRGVSLDILISVSKEAGRLLKPHLVILVPKLLESLSELEPSVINYLAVRASGAELERLDDARVAASKTSPIADTLNTCAQFVDAAVLVNLVPQLCDLLRSSPLGTKAGVCNFITSLCANCPNDVRGKSADRLLKSLMPNLMDRNATVRKQSASAIGNIIKFASDATVGSLFDYLKKLFLEKPDLADRTSIAKALQAIVNQTPDVVKNFGDQILPVVFIGLSGEVPKGDLERKNLVGIWEEIWTETTPGTTGGLRLYLSDIKSLCAAILKENPTWALKAEAGRALAKAAAEAGDSLSEEQARDLLDILKESLSGRTWTGKENLLFGIENICDHCRDVLSGMDSQWQTLLFDTVYKEAKKSNPDYRLAALKSLKSVVGCFKLAKFEELWAFVRPFLVDTEGSKSILGSDDESDDLQKKKEREEIKIGLTAALYSLMADSLICQSQNAPSLMEFLELLGRQLNKSYWKVQQPMIQCYVNVVKFHVENIVPSCLDSIATVATQCRDGSRQSTLVTSTNELLQLIEISRNRV